MNRIDFENWLISKGANKKKAEAYANRIEELCKILFLDQTPSSFWLKLDNNINEALLLLLYSSRKFNFLDKELSQIEQCVKRFDGKKLNNLNKNFTQNLPSLFKNKTNQFLDILFWYSDFIEDIGLAKCVMEQKNKIKSDYKSSLNPAKKIVEKYQKRLFFYPVATVGIKQPLTLAFESRTLRGETNNLSDEDIAQAFEVSRSTVDRWLKRNEKKYEKILKKIYGEGSFWELMLQKIFRGKRYYSFDAINDLLMTCKHVVPCTEQSKKINQNRSYKWSELLSSEKVADILGITTVQLAYYRKKNQISTFGPFERYPRYILEDVNRLKRIIKSRKK